MAELTRGLQIRPQVLVAAFETLQSFQDLGRHPHDRRVAKRHLQFPDRFIACRIGTFDIAGSRRFRTLLEFEKLLRVIAHER